MERIINGVLGIAFNKERQVLLTQRNQPGSPDFHLKWQLPGGGQEFGEHPEDTLKRELWEEVRLVCEVLNKRPFVFISFVNEGTTDAIQVNLFCYLISVGEQQPVIGDSESNDVRWVNIDDISSLPTLSGVNEIVLDGYNLLGSISNSKS